MNTIAIDDKQARAFLQPTHANIHQYKFNNPILYRTVCA
jgi:hypothetical protein